MQIKNILMLVKKKRIENRINDSTFKVTFARNLAKN